MYKFRWLKQILVIVIAVLLTSFSIDATDTLKGSQTALSILSRLAAEEDCAKGMVRIDHQGAGLCVDQYEASPDDQCPLTSPDSVQETQANLSDPKCQPRSTAGSEPWRFVTYQQAEQLCARAGKRLSTPSEWYQAALGTSDASAVCNLSTMNIESAGARADCVSGSRAFDMVGNVWEYVAGEIVDGHYQSDQLPGSGYVAGFAASGLPNVTDMEPTAGFGNDYFWMDPAGRYHILRGGYYGSREDGGIFATQGEAAAGLAGAAVGFRCVSELRI